ncbi:retrovirus-related Pol polyprotein from transposon 412 [Trichonephila clavipes]|nr:retrovirus-related Pol polyprotein from transposon 412 [Trichonephila clavipes]
MITDDHNRSLLVGYLHPILQTLFPGEQHIVFQEDNALVHTSHCVQTWLQELNDEVGHITWGPLSPNLNIIEAGLACSHPRMPWAHEAGFSRRSLAGVGFSESVRSYGPGLALLTNGGVQQQQHASCHPFQSVALAKDLSTSEGARGGVTIAEATMSLVYADKPQTLDPLEDNIRRVIADIRPQMLEKVIENWTSRLDHIRASRDSPMPEIIFKM